MRALVALLALTMLAGCTDNDLDLYGPFASAKEDGMKIEAAVAPMDDKMRLTATALNDGEREFAYMSGCQHEWDWSIIGADGPVDLGLSRCLGFQEARFGPGDTETFTFDWDGKDGQGKDRSGAHTFRIAFLYEGQKIQVQVPFEV